MFGPRVRRAVPVVVLAVLLAGCGGGGDDPATPPPTTPPASSAPAADALQAAQVLCSQLASPESTLLDAFNVAGGDVFAAERVRQAVQAVSATARQIQGQVPTAYPMLMAALGRYIAVLDRALSDPGTTLDVLLAAKTATNEACTNPS